MNKNTLHFWYNFIISIKLSYCSDWKWSYQLVCLMLFFDRDSETYFRLCRETNEYVFCRLIWRSSNCLICLFYFLYLFSENSGKGFHFTIIEDTKNTPPIHYWIQINLQQLMIWRWTYFRFTCSPYLFETVCKVLGCVQ